MTTCEELDPALADQGWQRSKRGNLWQKIDLEGDGELTVTIFYRDDDWTLCIAGVRGKLDYFHGIGKTETRAAAQALEILLMYLEQNA